MATVTDRSRSSKSGWTTLWTTCGVVPRTVPAGRAAPLGCAPVPRLLLAALPDADASAAGSEAGPTPSDEALTRLARALRDAGHEVVHAGQGVDERLVTAAAVQEDVAVVVLLAPPSYDAGSLAADLAGGPDDADDTIVLVTAGTDERAADVVRRVADEAPTG